MRVPSAAVAALLLMSGAARADDRSELLALEARWNQAVWERDAAALERILAPDFVIITAGGQTGGKAELIASVVQTRTRTLPFATRDVQVRVWGDAAVLTGLFDQTTARDGAESTATYRYTDVYVRTPEGWRAVSAQATAVR